MNLKLLSLVYYVDRDNKRLVLKKKQNGNKSVTKTTACMTDDASGTQFFFFMYSESEIRKVLI